MSRRELLQAMGAALVSAQVLSARASEQAGVTADASSDTYGIHFDGAGLICQRDDDGGDTAQREGMYWLALWVRDAILHEPWRPKRTLTFGEVMKALEVGSTGEFRRHPRQWNDPKDLSRDQTVPLVAAMGVWNDKERLERFYRELRRRNWLAQNGDVMGDPVNRNLVLRARDAEPNRLTDGISLRLAAGARVLGAKSSLDDVGDDLNMIVTLLMAAVRKPNNESDAAREFYAKNRPDNYGMFLASYRDAFGVTTDGSVSPAMMRQRMDEGIKRGWKPDCPRVLGAMRWYFRAESGGNPGLADMYEPIVKRWFQ